jgi:DNA polymerase-3 subunit epsilon
MTREITLDTETTGLSPGDGHRIVEIGCVELLNHVPTGKTYHVYINPERDMPVEAFRVHGLSNEFLADKPVFAEIAEGFIQFIATSPLIIHNAAFDLGFINAELKRLGRPDISGEREIIDTVQVARRKYPGAPANLDALCRRFDIDLSARTLHGALMDADLLAEVYLQLIGGREPGLSLVRTKPQVIGTMQTVQRTPFLISPSADELACHAELVTRLKDAIWATYSDAAPPDQGRDTTDNETR